MLSFRFKHLCFIATAIILFFLSSSTFSFSKLEKPLEETTMPNELLNTEEETYNEYIHFFEEVFETVEANYYKPVQRIHLDRFVQQFKSKIYQQLTTTGKSIDYVRWRSAALLIDQLKDPEDIFSAFYPPKPAKEYEGEALAKTIEVEDRMELGVDVIQSEEGYVVSSIEPRSDAYAKGLRPQDVLKNIDGNDLAKLTIEDVQLLLRPFVSSTAKIEFYSSDKKTIDVIEVEPKEFFKKMVFPIETKVPGVYGFRIERFNRKTSEDVFRYLQFFKQQGPMRGLIIDLRNNPGGPPLAARELSSFFLPGGDDFAYFKRNNRPSAELDVPVIDESFKYDGPMVILVNKESGSASELFSGILQRRGRAVLMGTHTAGQVLLKSMFHFDDESMVLLVTARGHHPDGVVFSFDGVKPDRLVDEEDKSDLVEYAQKYFVYIEQKEAAGNL